MTVLPLGAISRLERAFAGFEAEAENQELPARRCATPHRVLPHAFGEEFALGPELVEKRVQLAEIDADLAVMSAEGQPTDEPHRRTA